MARFLESLPVIFVDCQTTDTRPSMGRVVELGWQLSDSHEEVSTRVISLEPGMELPTKVRRLTQLGPEDFRDAIDGITAWQHLMDNIHNEKGVAIIHYARFEKPFLERLHTAWLEQSAIKIDFPFQIICTHEIVRRLLPELPSKGIRAVSGYFGESLPEAHRASHHVRATRLIWERLKKLLARERIITLDDLNTWLLKFKSPSAKAKKPRFTFLIPKELRLSVSPSPGIYRMRSGDGKILYVGKSRSLKSRVNSYFRGALNKKELLTQVAGIDVVETATALEAALLETDEIKRLNPPYNIALREGGRGIRFCSRDYLEWNDRPGDRCSLGPFRGLHLWESLLTIMNWEDEASRAALFMGEVSPSLIDEGFLLVFPRKPTSMSEILMRARRHWRESVGSEENVEIDSEEEGWNAERVAKRLRKILIRVIREQYYARWRCRLTECVIAWDTQDGRRRLIKMENGEMAHASFIKVNEPIPVPRGWRRSRLERQRVFDTATYDRIRVLVTEIGQACKAQGEVMVKLAPDLILQKEALLRCWGCM